MIIKDNEVKNNFLFAMCKLMFPRTHGVEYNKWRILSFMRQTLDDIQAFRKVLDKSGI